MVQSCNAIRNKTTGHFISLRTCTLFIILGCSWIKGRFSFSFVLEYWNNQLPITRVINKFILAQTSCTAKKRCARDKSSNFR